MRVAVVGSRDYPIRRDVTDLVNSLDRDTVLVSGGAQGVDRWAWEAACSRKLPKVIVLRPDYKRYPKWLAPKERNTTIVEMVDRLFAFWSRSGIDNAVLYDKGGTWDVICKAMVRRKVLRIFTA